VFYLKELKVIKGVINLKLLSLALVSKQSCCPGCSLMVAYINNELNQLFYCQVTILVSVVVINEVFSLVVERLEDGGEDVSGLYFG
jgi:hypothetical protein